MQYRYVRQPKDEDAFEEFCLVLLREHWSLSTLDRYGRRGERQDGVDLLDTGGGNPLRAVQCKHHEATKTLPPKEVEAEVEKAKGFPAKIGEFFILTTAKKSTQAQRKVRSINEDHADKGLFVVHLLTWDDIERVLENSPAGQAFLGVEAPQVVLAQVRAELQPVHDLVRDQGDDLHVSELGEVKKQLDEGQIQLAVLLLARIRNKGWDRMSTRHRGRWCALRADAEVRQGSESRAAELLIEAKTYQPDDDGAVSNEIMAYELLGNRTKAFELAIAAIASRPHCAAIYAAALRTAPSYAEFTRLLEQRPDHLKDHPEVWAAAAMRHDLETTLEKAEAIARKAVTLAPEDARAWFALGDLLLRTELAKVDPEGAPGGVAPDRSRVAEATECMAKVVDLSARRGIPGFQATALIRRATAMAFLNEAKKAHADIEEARRLAPNDAAVLLAAARLEEERGNHAGGVQLLRQAVMRQDAAEAPFLLGIALWNRNDPGDRAEAVETLARVGISGMSHVEPANELAVEGMITQGRYDDARKHLDQVESKSDRCLVATMRARTEAAAGDSDEATKSATAAVEKISSSTSRATLRKLGRLLVTQGRLADSLSIWERLLVKGEVSDDTRSFVEIAGRLGRDSKVLEVCEGARTAGIFDSLLLRWELQLLDRYDPGRALDLLVEFCGREPADKNARVNLVYLALRLGRVDLAESNIAMLPEVVDAEPEEGAAVVTALMKLGRPTDALKYAYDLLRRHFLNHHAHRAFRDAMLFRDQRGGGEIEVPVEAGPGIAVCLTEEGASAPLWFVIEDSQVAATAVDDEVLPNSGLGRRLAGKKVGDEVALSEGPGLKRSAVVSELLPKHVFRVRDVLDHWQYRFPDHQEMWMVRIGQPGDEDQPDFTALIEIAKEQHRRRKEAEAIYANKMITIKLFGEAVGQTEIYALAHLAWTDGLFLRCCVGSQDEYTEAVNALNASTDVVLDITALTTLWLLDELGVLDNLGKNPVVSHSTMDAVRAFAEKAKTNIRSEGSMSANDQGPLLVVPTSEKKEAGLLAAERFRQTVEEKCRIVGCPALAEVDSEERKLMQQCIGASALESAALGAQAPRVVWTDDGVAAHLQRAKFGTKRVWTQAVLRWLNERGVLSNERYTKASARLLGFQYMFTSVNPEVLRSCGNQADWRPERWPLRQALTYLSLDVVRPEDAAFLSAMLVAHCYLDTVLPETRAVLLQAASESLAKRTDGDRSVLLFRMMLGRVFGLNVAGQQDATRTFEAWRL